MVIFDLEDSVPSADRERARTAVRAAAREGVGGKAWAVRINTEASPDHGFDMVVVRDIEPDFVVLPKVTTSRQAHDAYLVCRTPVIAMIETPVAVLAASSISSQSGVVGLLVGTNDLRHGLRIPAAVGRDSITVALQSVVLAARATGKAVFDGVFNRIDDPLGFAAECTDGGSSASMGSLSFIPIRLSRQTVFLAPMKRNLRPHDR